MTEIARKIRVYGRVQGVGYRASALHYVQGLKKIRGYVRNCEDGSVEAVLVGAQDQVNQAIEWCRKGPATARVERVEVEEILESLEYQGFEIRR